LYGPGSNDSQDRVEGDFINQFIRLGSLDCLPDQSVNVPTFEEEAMDDISRKLAELPDLSRQQLLDLWRKLYRRPAPIGLRRELLIPFLGYRIQELAFGGLKPSTRAELKRIVKQARKPNFQVRPTTRIKAGTRIVREWGGENHEITVLESGFGYRKTVYHSLSEIARKITGTRWSGPAFFGLKGRK
jgi:hypothetical protein